MEAKVYVADLSVHCACSSKTDLEEEAYFGASMRETIELVVCTAARTRRDIRSSGMRVPLRLRFYFSQ